MSETVAILLAGGSGRRMGGEGGDKVLRPLLGKPALIYSVEAFAASGCVDRIVCVHRDGEQRAAIEASLASAATPDSLPAFAWVRGGAERQDSVLAALESISTPDALVLIHDGARPLLTPSAVRETVAAARKWGAAVLAHRVVDTVKRIDSANATGAVAPIDLDRSTLWAMETPQAFRCADILAAYRRIKAQGQQVTDDAAAHTAAGGKLALVQNPQENRKLTLPEDIVVVEALLRARSPS